MGYLTIMSFFDIRTKKLPKVLLLMGGMLTILFMGIWLGSHTRPWEELLVGWCLGALPGLALMALSLTTGILGLGDGCVIAMIGVLTGVKQSLAVAVWSFFGAGFYAGYLIVLRKVNRKYSFPLVPFIAAAYGIQMMFYRG